MFDSPPPSTITSGSRMLTITASPRPIRSVCRASAACARASPAAARAGRVAASRAPGPSQSIASAGAGDVAFQAAVQAAPARDAGQFVRLRPGQRDVAPFAGDALAAVDQAPVHHDAAAAAGADDHAEHRAMADAGAVRRLAEREAVGVVAHPHLARQLGAEVAVQRMAVQHLRVGVLHQPARRADHAGDADAQAAVRRPAPARPAAPDRRSPAASRRSSTAWHAPAVRRRAGGVEGHDLDLGAAEVDPEAEIVGRRRMLSHDAPLCGGGARCSRRWTAPPACHTV